ncbi:hypothetical protein FGM00_08225 [Aggregatimonas sangjinii]|uniref:Uncharacterized protein n=1 Tax=Aggregatimonas sangjinii TaxID=2583587 RepID=A0A5B7STA6_9FLAO|nr:hypothetical protein [Aggregatimonas sangjinii]QCX00090.1 hypothetical protein FGM00_08225 [Aggregatimonas sangjinii]
MVKKGAIELLEEILTSYKEGRLHLDRLKDPNSDCQVNIKVGNRTYDDCNELIQHYRDEHEMLAYTTIEVIEKDKRYYFLEIRDYAKGETFLNQYPLHTILNRNSCVTPTTRTW